MAQRSWLMYDTVTFGTTAGAVSSGFISKQGNTGKTKAATNMIGNGELPVDHTFEIMKIGVALHDALVLADIEKVLDGSYLEIFLNDQTMFLAPLRPLMQANAYGGVLELATAAAQTKFGLMNDGYELNPPILVEQNLSFKVEVTQGVAVSADTLMLVMLHGVLTRPGER